MTEKAFELSVAGIGTFGKRQQPRVLWAGVVPCPALENLQLLTVKNLHKVGVEFDEKPYSAHLTLGRFKSNGNLAALLGQLEKEQSDNLGSWTVNELLLLQSELKPEGAKHTVLHRVPLQCGAEL